MSNAMENLAADVFLAAFPTQPDPTPETMQTVLDFLYQPGTDITRPVKALAWQWLHNYTRPEESDIPGLGQKECRYSCIYSVSCTLSGPCTSCADHKEAIL